MSTNNPGNPNNNNNNNQGAKKKSDTPEMMNQGVDAARAGLDQAQSGFQKASDMTRERMDEAAKAASMLKTNAMNLQVKLFEISQTNASAAFDFARKALSVRDPMEFFRLQQEFVREQMTEFGKQAGEMNQIAMQLAQDAVKPLKDTIAKTTEAARKPFQS